MNRFVVGTGRCGSTLLSKMLACHPQVANVSEFFNGIDGRRFKAEPMGGTEFRELVCAPQPFLNQVLARGYPVPEVVYDLGDPGTRFGREGDLPWILGTTLPRLFPDEDADAAYAATCAFLEASPARSAPEHARALFDWWTARAGRTLWVERSGAAIDYWADLDRAFPEARFVHLHRQGEEAALSMREHHAFRLAIMLAYRLPPGTGRDDLGEALPDQDEITRLLESRPAAAFFGRWWNEQVARGAAAREGIPAERLLELRFEDLVDEPGRALGDIARFFALPDPDGAWIAAAAALVRGAPPARLPGLADEERAELVAACADGNRALGREPG